MILGLNLFLKRKYILHYWNVHVEWTHPWKPCVGCSHRRVPHGGHTWMFHQKVHTAGCLRLGAIWDVFNPRLIFWYFLIMSSYLHDRLVSKYHMWFLGSHIGWLTISGSQFDVLSESPDHRRLTFTWKIKTKRTNVGSQFYEILVCQ